MMGLTQLLLMSRRPCLPKQCIARPLAWFCPTHLANPLNARVAAFPFTTIDPNLGYGAFTTPCPCQRVGIRAEVCGAAGGHVELCASAAIFKKLNIPGLPAGMVSSGSRHACPISGH